MYNVVLNIWLGLLLELRILNVFLFLIIGHLIFCQYFTFKMRVYSSKFSVPIIDLPDVDEFDKLLPSFDPLRQRATQTEALFDIGVVDADAWSYCAHTPRDVLCSAEYEKKHKYLQACRIDVPPLLLSFFVFV